MTNIFIMHGVGGNDQENWFPWLKAELGKRGYEVTIPNFPTPDHQTLKHWLDKFSEYEPALNQNSIIVGHSLGVLFGLHIIEQHKVKAFIGVGGFSKLPGNKFDSGMATFAKDFDWEKIGSHLDESIILHGENDPYVTLETADELAGNLNTQAIIIPNGGHLNSASGYTKFPLLLEKITSLCLPEAKIG